MQVNYLRNQYNFAQQFAASFFLRSKQDVHRHKLLPGFEWISWKGFFIGLVETYGYGWFFALVWVPLYNVFVARYDKT